MKRFYFSKLATLIAVLLGCNAGLIAQTTTYNVGGTTNTYVVGPGVTSIQIDMAGAQGGTSSTGSVGGKGGRVQCVLAVSPGDVLNCFVGGKGSNFATPSAGGPNGAGGGAGGGNGNGQGAGGGGSTDIRKGGTSINNRIIVAGGGGGAGYDYATSTEWGGDGGGLTGGTGYYSSGIQYTCYCGSGGSQTSTGLSGGACTQIASGLFGPGVGSTATGYLGGGGGGYYGGGCGYYGGGGGGSSFFGSPGISLASTSPGYRSGDGYIKITPLTPTVTSLIPSFDFGTITVGDSSVPMFTVLSGGYLVGASGTITVTQPAGGFRISLDGLNYTSAAIPTVSIPYSGAAFAGINLYVQFMPGAPITYSGNITITGGSIPTTFIPVTGIGSTTACSGSPAPGTATITPASGDGATIFTLDVPGLSGALGYTYQWQSATTALGPWTNIDGAIRPQWSFMGISANTYYRCVVKCLNSGSSTNSGAATATFITGGNLAVNCAGTPNAGIAYTPITAGCAVFVDNIYNVGATTDSGIVHQWQISPDNIGWANASGASAKFPITTQTVSSTFYIRDQVTCTNSAKSVTTTPLLISLNTPPSGITGITNICSATPSLLNSATPGGTWASSNGAIAQVGSTGLVTGYGAGTATISYTLSTGCNAVITVTSNPSPASITGQPSVCTSQVTALSDITPGGSWSSSNISAATVDALGNVTGVNSGLIPTISYTLPSGCASMYTVTVNQLPAPITGGTSVCVGSGITLGESISGGNWTSSNSFKAGVSSTGFVTGIVASTNTISYTLPGGCYATKPMTVNSLPAAITGNSAVCVGLTTFLSDAGGGTWSSSNSSVATVGISSGNVAGIAAGTSSITYTLPVTGCSIVQAMTVNSSPAIFSVTGGGGYCSGLTGAHIGLSGSVPGVDYNLYNTSAGVSPVATVPGSSSGIDFGLWPAYSTPYTVQAVNSVSGCSSNMTGSATVFVNPLPVDYPVSTISGGTASYCAGTGGVDVYIPGSDVGINYQLMLGTTPVGPAVHGTGSGALHLGFQTASGVYTVIATNTTSLCSATMSGNVTISVMPNPTVYPVAASGSAYCSGGSGIDISMAATDNAITYYLYKGGAAVDSIVGTGGSIDFGNKTAAGCYTVLAVDGNKCQSAMAGTKCISINPLPNLYTVTGGGSFCAGAPGVHVGLNYSLSGTSYQLISSVSGNVGLPIGGANSSIDFGVQSANGTYTVQATNSYGCSVIMNGSATVTSNPAPNGGYMITGGGPYCVGGIGSLISLNGSDAGIIYTLTRGTTVVTSHTGAGASFNFGYFIPTGTYTATALDPVTGCTNTTTGSVTVSANPLPKTYTLSTGGSHCADDLVGNHITLSWSDPNVDYTLYLSGGSVVTKTGVGGVLDFGAFTTPGVYSAVGVDNTTFCTANMLGTASITVNPLPAVYTTTVVGTGSYCAGGAGVHVQLSGSNAGIKYQLYNPAVVGKPLNGTGGLLDFGLNTAAGSYTIVATNVLTGCSIAQAGTGVINVIAPPTPVTLSAVTVTKYCPGTPGADLQLSGSTGGVDYSLYNGSAFVTKLSGGASPLAFGPQTAGTYTAVAVDPVYGCTSNMLGSVKVTTYPVPTAYSVTGTGKYCATLTGLPVGLANSDNGVRYQLYESATTAIGTPMDGTAGVALNFGTLGKGVYTVVATDTTTTCANNMIGSATIDSISPLVPSVTAVASKDSVCESTLVIYTATPVNGGFAPTYRWMVNGINRSTGSVYTYAPKAGEIVSAMLTSSEACVVTDTAVSNDVTVVVNPSVTPTISVSSNAPSNTVCLNANTVTFTAAITGGGSAPIYEWKKNGLPVGTSSPTYTTTVSNGDKVFGVLASNAECSLAKFVYSTPVAMTVNEPVTPDFKILSDPGTAVQKGDNITFTALVLNVTSADSFTYKWSLNGTAIPGATKGVYTTNTLADNDAVSCTVTSHTKCGTDNTTHQVFMTVGTTGIKTIGIAGNVRVVPNPNKGAFTVTGNLSGDTDEEVSLEITNMLGQVVYNNKTIAHNGVINEQVQLNNTLANGMYLLNLSSGTDHKVFHFVIEQ
jgi:hypothetical protein